MKPRTRTCSSPACAAEFVPRTPDSSYCSRACYNAERTGRARGPYKAPRTKVCPKCGTEFVVGGVGNPPLKQIYCSQSCSGTSKDAPARTMTDVETAWLAGIFDGEGSIVFPKARTKKSVRIVIYNTCLPMMEKVLEVTGTGKVVPRTRTQDHHKQCWYWQCYSDNARLLLRQMLPFLLAKRERAQEALDA